MSEKILVIDDEETTVQLIAILMERRGYEVIKAFRADEGLRKAYSSQPDLVLLDIMMPDMDGWDVCRRLREMSDVPIIFLTARGEVRDVVRGLEMGADDYVIKPYDNDELVARVRVVLRRGQGSGILAGTNGFEHDPEGHRIRYRGHLLDLTRYEYGLLAALLQRPGAVLSRAQLMDRVWGDALESGDRTIDTHIKTLRAKLRVVAPDEDPIRTHRGLGYSLEA